MKIIVTLTILLWLNREGVCEKLQVSDRQKGVELNALQTLAPEATIDSDTEQTVNPNEFPTMDGNWVFEAPNNWIEPIDQEKGPGKISAPREYLAVRTQNGITQYLIPTSETPNGYKAATESFTTRVH